MVLPKVVVISLGGTIASTRAAEGPGVTPTLTADALIGTVPELREAAEVEATQFRMVPGSDVTLDDVVELAREVEGCLDGGAEGVVVTQGTDSIEEVAFGLDLLVGAGREAPIVVTGAMRNPMLPGADGPANLLASVIVAGSEAARGLGAVVVFGDEIHAARYVRKTHAQAPAAFSSPLTGPVGYLAEGEPRVAVRPAPQRRVTLPPDSRERPVALYKMGIGDDGRLLRGIEAAGYLGLVVEAMGGGHVPSHTVEPLAELAARMPVVLASRTGGGEALKGTYDFPGSEMDLVRRGLIPAGPLDGPKARVLLSLLLRSGAQGEEIAAAFDPWG